MNRPIRAALVLAALATGAAAQTTPKSPADLKAPAGLEAPAAASCPACGVVRSVKRVETAPRITSEERKSTAGLVASVPLGGGKPSVGSSTALLQERNPVAVRFEVVVRLDDGRFQVVMQDDAGGLREGDKVRIDRGKVVSRGP